MPFLLRKIRKSKWENLPTRPGEIRADALIDLKTDNDDLSLWIIDDECSNVDLVISALVADSYKQLEKFDYALLGAAEVQEAGFLLEKLPGNTLCGEANEFHRDIRNLTAGDILTIAAIVKKSRRERRQEWEVGQLVDKALKDGTLDGVRYQSLLDSLEEKRSRWERL